MYTKRFIQEWKNHKEDAEMWDESWHTEPQKTWKIKKTHEEDDDKWSSTKYEGSTSSWHAEQGKGKEVNKVKGKEKSKGTSSKGASSKGKSSKGESNKGASKKK